MTLHDLGHVPCRADRDGTFIHKHDPAQIFTLGGNLSKILRGGIKVCQVCGSIQVGRRRQTHKNRIRALKYRLKVGRKIEMAIDGFADNACQARFIDIFFNFFRLTA